MGFSLIHPMDSRQAIRVPLRSFPGTFLTLPEGSQLLTPQPAVQSTPLQSSHLLETIQTRLRLEKARVTRLTGRKRFRILLLLPDKTRRQCATRLALDALLDLCEREHDWSLDIVFGLGTHPLMQAHEIEQMLGRERLHRLDQMGSALHQQSTLSSLPLRPHTVAAPSQIESGNGASSSREVLLEVPDILWNCDMILVAGDTDLHPYEGRAGSGGIHKMIAIGIGCLSTIQITHSMSILTHPQTRAGEAENQFVKTVDHFAKAIINALMHPRGRLHCAPLGISAIAGEEDQPIAFWIGNHEEERAALLQELKRERTLDLTNAVDFVVADTEPEKGTDLLAGARSLHFLCSYDDSNNPLLCQLSPCRTAVMYNPCHQLLNTEGIGNTGTVLHLKALRHFALEALHSVTEAIPPNQDRDHIRTNSLEQGQNMKAAILCRWERYLNLVSEEDEVFARLEQLLIDHDEGKTSIADVLTMIDNTLPNSFGAHHHILEVTHMHLRNTNVVSARMFVREALETLGFKGLGEGGQRALRLLSILRKFDQLLVATLNPAVLEFLNSDKLWTGDEQQFSQPSRRADKQPNRPFEAVGLYGISLRKYSPQQGLELAIERHRQLQEYSEKIPSGDRGSQLRVAFLQEPVILMRSR